MAVSIEVIFVTPAGEAHIPRASMSRWANPPEGVAEISGPVFSGERVSQIADDLLLVYRRNLVSQRAVHAAG